MCGLNLRDPEILIEHNGFHYYYYYYYSSTAEIGGGENRYILTAAPKFLEKVLDFIPWSGGVVPRWGLEWHKGSEKMNAC